MQARENLRQHMRQLFPLSNFCVHGDILILYQIYVIVYAY